VSLDVEGGVRGGGRGGCMGGLRGCGFSCGSFGAGGTWTWNEGVFALGFGRGGGLCDILRGGLGGILAVCGVQLQM
jgi:hypothetical protein